MSDSQHTIRTYRPADFDSYVRLHVEAEKWDNAGHCTSPRLLRDNLGRPDYSPELDLFVAEAAGEVVGCLNVTPELGIGRVILSCLVHPDHRRRGIATQLYHRGMGRASALGAGVAQACTGEDNTAATNLLAKLGFVFVRRYLELRLKLSDFSLSEPVPIRVSSRPLQPGEERALADLQNRSFTGTWGYNPCTAAHIAHRVGSCDAGHDRTLLVFQGDQPVAYCWTTVDVEGNTAAGAGKARVHMLGVLPEHRGSGLGRYALFAGLRRLQEMGAAVVEITVDSENVEACALYESFGFKTWSTTAWYEKVVE